MKKILFGFITLMLSLPIAAIAHLGEEVEEHVEYMNNNWTGMGHMYGSGPFFWIIYLTSIVWLLVGVLLIVWLWQKISKK